MWEDCTYWHMADALYMVMAKAVGKSLTLPFGTLVLVRHSGQEIDWLRLRRARPLRQSLQ